MYKPFRRSLYNLLLKPHLPQKLSLCKTINLYIKWVEVWNENLCEVFHQDRFYGTQPRRGFKQPFGTFHVFVRLRSWTRDPTEPRKSLGTWLREMSSYSCLTFLPGPAWVLLSKICKDFFTALYSISSRYSITFRYRADAKSPAHSAVIRSSVIGLVATTLQ